MLPLTNHLTELSQTNGLNEPEFLWSPYFGQYPSLQAVRQVIIFRLRDLLASVPKLGWLHVQDGVGAHSKKHSDGTITYPLTAEDVISYFNNVLIPASGTLRSLRLNMEFFVFGPDGIAMYSGDPREQDNRQSKYKQANVPVGISFEIRYWYGSLYYRTVPNVEGKDTNRAFSEISHSDLVPIFNGPALDWVVDQSPEGGKFVPRISSVTLTTGGLVTVPNVRHLYVNEASTEIQRAGLRPNFTGGGEWVETQSPPKDRLVPQGTIVTMTTRSGPLP